MLQGLALGFDVTVTKIQFIVTLGKLDEGNDKISHNHFCHQHQQLQKINCLVCVKDISKWEIMRSYEVCNPAKRKTCS